MADDATLPPSSARIRRAWAAGRRPSAMWLSAGIALLGVGGVASLWRPDPAALTSSVRRVLEDGGDGAIELAIGTLGGAILGAAAIAAIVLAAVLVAGLVQGGLGPVDPGLEARLGAPAVRSPVLLGIVLAALLLALAAGDVTALVTGGARAAAASESAVIELWHRGLAELVVALGASACAVGLVETWWSRRQGLAALAVTLAQAREEAREHRGRRR